MLINRDAKNRKDRLYQLVLIASDKKRARHNEEDPLMRGVFFDRECMYRDLFDGRKRPPDVTGYGSKIRRHARIYAVEVYNDPSRSDAMVIENAMLKGATIAESHHLVEALRGR